MARCTESASGARKQTTNQAEIALVTRPKPGVLGDLSVRPLRTLRLIAVGTERIARARPIRITGGITDPVKLTRVGG